MEGVGRILNQLRGPQGDEASLDSQRLIQVRDALDGRTIGAADNQERGFEEIPDCRALPQKFRMRYHAHARQIGEYRLRQLLAGAGENGAADRDNQGLGAPRYLSSDLPHGPA